MDADGGYVGRVERADAERGGRRGRCAASPSRRTRSPRSETLEELLRNEPLRRMGALAVVDAAGRLRGVVTTEHVARALRTKLVPG